MVAKAVSEGCGVVECPRVPSLRWAHSFSVGSSAFTLISSCFPWRSSSSKDGSQSREYPLQVGSGGIKSTASADQLSKLSLSPRSSSPNPSSRTPPPTIETAQPSSSPRQPPTPLSAPTRPGVMTSPMQAVPR